MLCVLENSTRRQKCRNLGSDNVDGLVRVHKLLKDVSLTTERRMWRHGRSFVERLGLAKGLQMAF